MRDAYTPPPKMRLKKSKKKYTNEQDFDLKNMPEREEAIGFETASNHCQSQSKSKKRSLFIPVPASDKSERMLACWVGFGCAGQGLDGD